MSVTTMGNAVPAVVSVVTGPVLAQALSVDGRGAVAAAMAPFVLLSSLAMFGIPEASTYLIAAAPGRVRHVLRRSAAMVSVTGAAAAAAGLLAASFFSGGDQAIERLMIIAAAATVPSMLVGCLRGVAYGLGLWRFVAMEKTISSLARLLLLVPLWMLDALTPTTATLVLVCTPLLGGLPYLVVLRRRGTPQDTVRTRQIASYGMRVWVGALTGILLMRIDQSLVTPLSDVVQTGLYVVAVSISELPLILTSAVRDVTFVSETARSDDQRLAATARLTTLASATGALVLGLTLPWWLPALFGSDFSGSVLVAQILLVAVVLGQPGSIAGSGLSARGRPGARSISMVIACVLNIGLLVALVPTFGAVGAALATLAGNMVAGGLNVVFIHRLYGISWLSFLGVRRSDLTVVRGLARRLTRRLTRRPDRLR
ncbi:hypothetical protein GCM10009809_29550 [Isoptericola hypogeus]|uniref:O-antigen/teichoic acid export membrane protein n=1 Tax=Isoptericola hypogeus TaxID=300179 RepID=A0ABN2JMA9_9MICO